MAVEVILCLSMHTSQSKQSNLMQIRDSPDGLTKIKGPHRTPQQSQKELSIVF